LVHDLPIAMKKANIQEALSDLSLGGLLFFPQTESTNDTAKGWAMNGAADLSVVYAEEQTHGRGRGSRTWVTNPGTGLAFSVILHPTFDEENYLQRFTGLGALAVCEAIESLGLLPQIKWPNDILLHGRKFCGILVESGWMDGHALYVVLGIGINISDGSVPINTELNYPATCLEAESQAACNRSLLLIEILKNLIKLRPQVAEDGFLFAWEKRLAFMGEKVSLRGGEEGERVGWVRGLERDGSLRLLSQDGEIFSVHVGEIQLRPLV
jgi:BirA family transcriptional regulator, biotin operon repressor / biotin---[acetyl-CoA-carboxylase] ligase